MRSRTLPALLAAVALLSGAFLLLSSSPPAVEPPSSPQVTVSLAPDIDHAETLREVEPEPQPPQPPDAELFVQELEFESLWKADEGLSVEREPVELAAEARLASAAFEAPSGDASSTDEGDELTESERLALDQTASSDTSLRNADYPRTYISRIRVDITSPNHWVRLTWSGPLADRQKTGPFHSSPGRGLGYNNCDDVAESNRNGSNCTPKGTMRVQGFSDSMRSYPQCRFVTWFEIGREVAFHYYPQVPNYPASHGCVRLGRRDAQLIHNNSKIGDTEVIVEGTWKFVR